MAEAVAMNVVCVMSTSLLFVLVHALPFRAVLAPRSFPFISAFACTFTSRRACARAQTASEQGSKQARVSKNE